ncbi:response regulator [Planomonospora venezuelensis]|uniref:Circadian input-output histidine kinase CikA n=1 Tax=Planomonospora venezuelensis TaxID=1999 RepID=A0A841CZB5_PLAVE|nr:response regulator [Planomonospora venezuelensis]MBB5961327.1 PAS domain S-box-containing protein [Planomonospora venezuelensis]GIN01931.1 hypothetical protein Pve01_35890 [Planomonospora venezuelensis]
MATHRAPGPRPGRRLLPAWLAGALVTPLVVLPVVRAVQASTDDLAVVAAGSLVMAALALVHLLASAGGPLTEASVRRALRRSVLRLCAAVTVLGLLPLAGLAYLSVREDTGTVRAEVERRLVTSVDVSVAYVGDQLATLRELVGSYADRRLLRKAVSAAPDGLAGSGRPEIDRHVAELTSRDPAFAGAWVLDAAGTLLSSVPSQPAAAGTDFSSHDYVQGVLRTGEPYVSDAFTTALPGGPRVVAIAAPVTDGGRVVGVLAAGYRLEALESFTDRLADVQKVRLKLTDRRGTLLAGVTGDGSGLSSGAGDEHVAAALAGSSGTGRSTENGVELDAAYQPVPGLDWAAVAEVPTREAFAGTDRFAGRTLAVTLSLAQMLLAGLVLAAYTDRRRRVAEAVLAHREEQVSAILDAAGDAFVSVDGTGRINRWNSQAEAVFGRPVEQALGRPLTELMAPGPQRDAHAAAFARVPTGGGPHLLNRRMEVQALRRDGTAFPAEVTAWTSSAGGHTTFSAFVRDITERRRQEAELAAARDEALAASRMKSEFVANMSHEIRTPMNGVIGLTSLLLDTRLDARQRDYLTTVQSSADALLNVINDILDFSKIEAGKLEIDPVDFDVRALAEDVVSLLAAGAQAKGLEIAAVVHPAIPPAVRGDAHRIRQVLTNLVSNAVKFTERGEIVVEVGVGPAEGEDRIRQVHISVADTGVGIPADRQAGLFDAFTQVDASTTRRYGGTGLGLTISRQLVELMGGTIGLTSRPGHGSRFHFTLSLPDAAAPSVTPPPPADLAGVRVLVVDDNRTNRTVVHDLLTSWGMRAHSSPDAHDALAVLRDAAGSGDPFGVALLDMHMPGFDGLQLARAVAADPSVNGVRLAMLTSTNQAGEAQAARACGIEVYLTKPVRAAQLRAALLQLLGRAPDADAPEPVADPGTASADDRAGNGMRILVAEDNEVNQQVVTAMLARLGYAADVAGDGEKALRLLRAGHYDAVLMDCQMPRLDGFQATERIRRLPAPLNAVPVVALTASALASDEQRCLAAGMDAFLAKPLRGQELDAVLRTVLRSGTGPAGSPDGPAAPAAAAGPPEAVAPAAASGRLDSPEALLDPGILDELREMGPSFVERILPSYLRNTAAAAVAITAAAARNDMRELARLAHKLRGSSGSFAGRRLSATCTALEQAALDGDVGGVTALAGVVAHQADATCRALRTALAAEG